MNLLGNMDPARQPQPSHKCGIFVEPECPKELVNAITKLHQKPKKELKQMKKAGEKEE